MLVLGVHAALFKMESVKKEVNAISKQIGIKMKVSTAVFLDAQAAAAPRLYCLQ